MATPGWYPDPAGRPGAYRYWDGQTWGPDVTDSPFGDQAAGPAAPTPAPANPFDTPTNPEQTSVAPAYEGYQDYGQQYPLAAPPPPGPVQPGWAQPAPYAERSGPGKVLGLVLLAVVVTIALGVATFFVTRTFLDDDETTATSDPATASDVPTVEPPVTPTPTPTPEQSPEQSPGEQGLFNDTPPTIQQCTGGEPEVGATGVVGNQLTGGGLTMRKVSGFGQGPEQSAGFVFADGVTSTSRTIEQSAVTGWVAVYMLGGLDKSLGFNTPEQAALVVMECMATSPDFYTGFTGASLTDSRATTVSGADAWVVEAQIDVDDPLLSVTGDVAQVVVVDTGDPETFGLYVSLVPIGDQALIAQQQAQEKQLKVG